MYTKYGFIPVIYLNGVNLCMYVCIYLRAFKKNLRKKYLIFDYKKELGYATLNILVVLVTVGTNMLQFLIYCRVSSIADAQSSW